MALLAQVAAIALISGCGPMNAKPATSNDLAGSCNGSLDDRSDPTFRRMIGQSKKHAFIVLMRLGSASSDVTTESTEEVAAGPQVGNNEYVIRIVRGADLLPPSPNAELKVTYLRTSGQMQTVYPATTQHREDGSYATDFTFKKSGTWEIRIHVTDGELEDDHAVQITI